MPLLARKGVVGVKLEGTPYTFDAPAAANCFPAYDITFTPEGEVYQRKETRSHYGKLDVIPGPRSGKIGFKALLVGSGTRGSTTNFHLLAALKAAGMMITATASTSIVIKPASTFSGSGNYPGAAYSIVSFVDGARYAIKGAVGNVKVNCTLGEPIELEFEFSGAYVDTADVAVPTPTGVSTVAPPTFLGAGLTLMGFSAKLEKLSFDMGNVIAPIRSANDSTGLLGYMISDRRITGSVDPLMELVATEDFFGKWKAGTTGAIQTGTLGASAGNILQLAAPRCQYDVPSPGDKEGLASLELPFQVVTQVSGAEGDDFSITIT